MGDQVFRRVRPVLSRNGKNGYGRCRDSILHIHRWVIIDTGEEREQGLEDAVINPMAVDGFCDRVGYCPDCFSKAALAIDYIANFHPFVEGNKRTAFQVALALLRKGGFEFDDDIETYRFIRDVAAGIYNREEVEGWLRCNTHLSSP